MTIGNSINLSVPVTGTTVETLTKYLDGIFSGGMTIGGVDYPAMLTLRPAQISSNRKRISASYRCTPSTMDDPGVRTKGSCSIAFTIDANLGTVMTEAEAVLQTKYALAALLSSTLLETLAAGSDI